MPKTETSDDFSLEKTRYGGLSTAVGTAVGVVTGGVIVMVVLVSSLL